MHNGPLRIACRAALLALSLTLPARYLLQAQQAVSADEIKVAMVYNFTKFIEWPPDASPDTARQFVIAVLGPTRVASLFDQALRSRTVLGRPVAIRHAQTVEEARRCQIVVVSSRESSAMQEALQTVRAPGVLTVGEGKAFTQNGGVIGFVLVDNRLNFEVNLEAARQARLVISSKLLRLALVKAD